MDVASSYIKHHYKAIIDEFADLSSAVRHRSQLPSSAPHLMVDTFPQSWLLVSAAGTELRDVTDEEP